MSLNGKVGAKPRVGLGEVEAGRQCSSRWVDGIGCWASQAGSSVGSVVKSMAALPEDLDLRTSTHMVAV